MFISGGRYTSESSVYVATALKYAGEHPDVLVILDTVVYQQQEHGRREEVLEKIKIRLDPHRQHTDLANGSQIMRCLTAGNKRCDIILAPVETRKIEPALVLIEAD